MTRSWHSRRGYLGWQKCGHDCPWRMDERNRKAEHAIEDILEVGS